MLLNFNIPGGVSYVPVTKPGKIISISGAAHTTPTTGTVVVANGTVTPVQTVTLTGVAAGVNTDGAKNATYGDTVFAAGDCIKFTNTCGSSAVAVGVCIEFDEFNL